MPASSHTPSPDAPAKEWITFLKGRGYLKDTEPKPVSNYKSLHGFWVPPRLGSGGVKTVRRKSGGRAPGAVVPDRSWYSKRMLTALYRYDRATFDKLVDRVRDIKVLVAEEEAAEQVQAHRRLLEPAVEAGLLNQAEADRKLAAWAKAQGLTIPKS